MLNIFKKQAGKNSSGQSGSDGRWEEEARQALEQAIEQIPGPAVLKNTMRKKLSQAAENQARQDGRDNVTVQDLMRGLLSQLPAGMRGKVEEAAKQGPEGLKNWAEDLKNK